MLAVADNSIDIERLIAAPPRGQVALAICFSRPLVRSGHLAGLLVLCRPSIRVLAMAAVGSICNGCASELDASAEAISAGKEKPSIMAVRLSRRVLVRA